MKDAVLMFDLGGVVVPWVGFEALAEMTGLDRETLDLRFGNDPATSRFETGHASPDEFCEAFPRVFDLDLAADDVPALWNSWVRPPFPGVVDAIMQLGTTHRTACLSNTNALHWAHIQQFFDTDVLFDVPLASHHMRLAKPDPAIYHAAIDRMDVAPADIHFFEDTTRNIDAAREAGLTVHTVDRLHGVLPVLRALGLT